MVNKDIFKSYKNASAEKAVFMCCSPIQSIYKSLVRPHVEYCVSAWSPHYIKDKDILERIQHRFTRLIPGMQKLTYMECLDKLNLWTLEERRNRSDLIEVFNMAKNLTHTVDQIP